MSKLMKYLSEAKSAMVTCPQTLHVVMGNEACDLDSAVSALLYAFLLHSLQEEKRMIVPVLNIPREDYPLKTEVTYWLDKHNIHPNHLIFRNELDLTMKKTSNVMLTLIDHNVLSVNDSNLEGNVISILDHHTLEWPNPESVKDGVVIDMVGSCATLVTEDILKRLPEILESTVVSLLYGTIILDTVNLSEAAKRVTEKDIEMCRQLESCLSPSPDSTKIFKELTTAKSDVSHLSSEQLLRKDVKIAENNGVRVAVASVPMLVKAYLERPDISSAVAHHSEKENYNILVIMGIVISGDNVCRDIAIFSNNADLKMKMEHHLCNAGEGILQLVPLPTQVEGCVAYEQENHAASRKVVLPFIREWLSMKTN